MVWQRCLASLLSVHRPKTRSSGAYDSWQCHAMTGMTGGCFAESSQGAMAAMAWAFLGSPEKAERLPKAMRLNFKLDLWELSGAKGHCLYSESLVKHQQEIRLSTFVAACACLSLSLLVDVELQMVKSVFQSSSASSTGFEYRLDHVPDCSFVVDGE